MRERVTETEVGPIHHKPPTKLSEPRRCIHGHLAPRYRTPSTGYRGGNCVICQKLHCQRQLAEKARGVRGTPIRLPAPSPIRTWTRYEDARAWHFEQGGYLVRLEDGRFGTTDDATVVRRLRGRVFLTICDKQQCWDEVEMDRPQ